MTIKLIYSQQYRKPCVVALPTDAADDVIAACRASGAVIREILLIPPEHAMHGERGPCAFKDCETEPCQSARAASEEFVVQLRDDVGPELWTEAALHRSLGKGI